MFRVLGNFRVFAPSFVSTVFEIGKIDIHDSVQQTEYIQRVIRVSVEYDRKVKATFGGDRKRLYQLWNKMCGRNPVDVVATLAFKLEKYLGQGSGPHS